LEDQKETILIVEDDNSLREGLAMNFTAEGYRVLTAADGEEGLKKAFDTRPDLIVLDIMLPQWSGLEILSELRQHNQDVPVLILSARDTTAEKVNGLQLGADDYLTKPFELAELLARIEVMLRRRRAESYKQPVITFGDVVIDPATRTVTKNEQEIDLSAKEFEILYLLARFPKRPFSRDEILDRVWGWGFEGTTRTVDNFILGLRQKLESDPTKPRHIITVRQVGYKFEE
jgi:DNA-binding response OmpR family regulator